MNRKYLVLIFVLCVVNLSLVVSMVLRNDEVKSEPKEKTVEKTQKKKKKKEKTQEERSAELTEEIENYLATSAINTDQISIAVYDLENDQSYEWNSEVDFIAASIYKVPLAMLWYDMIADGEVSIDDSLQITTEDGLEEGYTLWQGNYEYPLKEVLSEAIVHSDNIAARALYRNLGSWRTYRQLATKYSNQVYTENFFAEENYLTTHYMMNCIKYLYEHPKRYAALIEDMKEATPNDYLDTSTKIGLAQKWGQYSTSTNAAGFVECENDYVIVVFTSSLSNPTTIMGDINQICYDHFNEE